MEKYEFKLIILKIFKEELKMETVFGIIGATFLLVLVIIGIIILINVVSYKMLRCMVRVVVSDLTDIFKRSKKLITKIINFFKRKRKGSK